MKRLLLSTLLAASCATAAIAAEGSEITLKDGQKISIHIEGVDDDLACSLGNGNFKPLVASHFGWQNVEVEFTGALTPGRNTLRCEVNDDQKGASWSVSYEIKVDGQTVKSTKKTVYDPPGNSTLVLTDETIINR